MALRLKPGPKKAIAYLAGSILFYWLFLRKRIITEKYEFTLNSVDPKTVWEFWADFSNYQKINPTVIDFEIDYERGTYEHWEYGVSYWEHLTILPFNVFMKGKYIVTPEQKRGHFSEPYRISSESDACVGIFCTHTDADMTFDLIVNTKSTKVTETVNMDCSPIMTWYQRAEFRKQRQYISEQLQHTDFTTLSK